jgi:hypothetical protein
MAEIRLRERRTTLLLTLYTLVGWAAYAGVWYLQPAFLPHLGGERGTPVEGALKAVPVFLGPILCVLSLVGLAVVLSDVQNLVHPPHRPAVVHAERRPRRCVHLHLHASLPFRPVHHWDEV